MGKGGNNLRVVSMLRECMNAHPYDPEHRAPDGHPRPPYLLEDAVRDVYEQLDLSFIGEMITHCWEPTFQWKELRELLSDPSDSPNAAAVLGAYARDLIRGFAEEDEQLVSMNASRQMHQGSKEAV